MEKCEKWATAKERRKENRTKTTYEEVRHGCGGEHKGGRHKAR